MFSIPKKPQYFEYCAPVLEQYRVTDLICSIPFFMRTFNKQLSLMYIFQFVFQEQFFFNIVFSTLSTIFFEIMKVKKGHPRVVLRDVLSPWLGKRKISRSMFQKFKCRVQERDLDLFPDFGDGPAMRMYVIFFS
jgi:hypothetical protein